MRGSQLLGIHGVEAFVTRLIHNEHSAVFTEIRDAEAAGQADLVARRIKVHDDMTVVSFKVTSASANCEGK